jgi:hypothetical protein
MELIHGCRVEPSSCCRLQPLTDTLPSVQAEASEQAYQDLYDNHEGMLDDLASFWRMAASNFASNPGVIGYEIMNEPFPGNLYADPTLALPGEAGRRNLQRMNDKVVRLLGVIFFLQNDASADCRPISISAENPWGK